jgi:hypothetical protein
MKANWLHLLLITTLGFLINLPLHAQSSGQVSPPNDGRNVKISPEIRIIQRQTTIPTIKMEMIQQFLNRPQLITEEQIEEAGYILANAEQSILSTKGNDIYVAGLNNWQVGSQYIIVRLGQTYYSPLEDEEDEVLAYEAIFLGEAILTVPGEPATLNITNAVREIKTGDFLLPLEEESFIENFHPHSPPFLEDTYVIAVVNGGGFFIGQFQVVVINKGRYQGIERGHLLAVNKGTRPIYDNIADEQMILPKRRAGTLFVFSVFDNVSYALVMSSYLPINLLDEVTTP